MLSATPHRQLPLFSKQSILLIQNRSAVATEFTRSQNPPSSGPLGPLASKASFPPHQPPETKVPYTTSSRSQPEGPQISQHQIPGLPLSLPALDLRVSQATLRLMGNSPAHSHGGLRQTLNARQPDPRVPSPPDFSGQTPTLASQQSLPVLHQQQTQDPPSAELSQPWTPPHFFPSTENISPNAQPTRWTTTASSPPSSKP